MSHGFLPNEFQNSDKIDEVIGLDLTLSAMGMTFCSHRFMPLILDNDDNNWSRRSFEEENRDNKRLKGAINGGNSDGGMSRNGSNGSLSSLSSLHFRDHILTYSKRYLAAEAVEEAAAAAAAMAAGYEENGVEEDETAYGMRLVQVLIACAEAVACRDKSHASALLSELRTNALVFGSSFQRVASCFLQGLADRLASVQPPGTAVGRVQLPPVMNIMDIMSDSDKKQEAFRLVYEICPHINFGHFVANLAILEAFEGESLVHVVDLGMTLGLPQGHQWRHLIQSLAATRGGAGKPHCIRLRITAVGLCVDRFDVIGKDLKTYAKSMGINLEFNIVESNLENLKPENIKVSDDEVLVVNSILQLHCVVKESRGALNSVLQMIHELSPKLLVLVEQDSSHNGPFFLGRFMEALHYYSAIFDSLDAMLPKYDTRRAKMEQFYFAEEIKNIVSCEGADRVERHERVDQWRRRMSRAGFQATPLRLMSQAKQWLGNNKVCEGYTVVEDKGCLVLGWNAKPIVAVSCWKC
ncbi:hypothetical protein ES319_A09G261400v1 [Gossypium barbadense]|uniref:Uncharacterized protein n=2 Tax=Gossypium TaxID=3633 RepID=A0A5J5UIW8_GOSBA|nr:hypothetical protein ES319_A09G261400v1 [Gossypium barbadense]TYH04306.1 hypothetical protein ES288_A09G287500v1 [Gossypium darwinii]